MASKNSNDESLVERGEVLFPESDVIDSEPLYNNFTAIQNNLRQQADRDTHQRSQSSDARYRAVRAHVESPAVRSAQSTEQLTLAARPVPIQIRSKKVDGHIFNLAQIVQDIGCQQDTPFMRSASDASTKNVSALLNVVLKMGGAHGPLVNVWRSRIDEEYFQRWYLEKYYHRSASLTQYGTQAGTTSSTRARDYHSSVLISNVPAPTKRMASQTRYESEIQKIYGCDDGDLTTASSLSSQSSSVDTHLTTPEPTRPVSITSILKKPNTNNNNNTRNTPTKHHVTIVDHLATDESDQSISSQELLSGDDQLLAVGQHYENVSPNLGQYENVQANLQQYENVLSNREQYASIPSSPYQQVPSAPASPYQPVETVVTETHTKVENQGNTTLSEYQQVLQNHPDAYSDPSPEIITKSNPGQEVTYEQNISLRYLAPPTPPPPGPLIIREILPPREPTPPPLIVKVQDPAPPTPPPLVLREAPPPLPPHQEATIVTKVLPAQTPPQRRIIFERCPPLPPKPQSVIIEKWLPYKPPPPREVIVERVTERKSSQDTDSAYSTYERQRRHSAECTCDPPRMPAPMPMQRQKSYDQLATGQLERSPTTTYDQMVWTTHQQILAMQQRGFEQLQATQQWAANQWQNHANMYLPYANRVPQATLAMNRATMAPPMNGYVQTEEIRQQRVHYNTGYYYPYH